MVSLSLKLCVCVLVQHIVRQLFAWEFSWAARGEGKLPAHRVTTSKKTFQGVSFHVFSDMPQTNGLDEFSYTYPGGFGVKFLSGSECRQRTSPKQRSRACLDCSAFRLNSQGPERFQKGKPRSHHSFLLFQCFNDRLLVLSTALLL